MNILATSRSILKEDSWAEGLRYVARQPILDPRGCVHAYELLFRAGPETAFRGDQNRATSTMLDNVAMFGLEKLAGGLPVFVNCTLETLAQDLSDVLPTSLAVLEILETVDPTPSVLQACLKLKAKGYRLALDDFVWGPKFDPLVELADYIKVDFLLSGPEERVKLFERLRGRPVAMLAEKVETPEEYQQAKEEGFTLFQGYYFCHPVLMMNRKIPANRMIHFEILQMLQDDDIDLDKATQLMKRNPSLTYRLLRLVNSPAYAIRNEIHSVKEALLMIGEKTFRHIVMLAIASDLNGKQPLEVLHMALLRARFCELASGHYGLKSCEQYLLGMLSMLPAMMLMPMEDLAPALPLRNEIQAALRGTANRERVLLGWLESRERGDWITCYALAQSNDLHEEELDTHYRLALVWAAAALEVTSSRRPLTGTLGFGSQAMLR
jgi:c-di-GMP-related signal transduction protein